MSKELKVHLIQGDGLTLLAKSDSNHWIVFDTSEEYGGNSGAIKPFEAFIASLGGCTGMDVLSILNKMRVPFQRLLIEITVQSVEDHPKIPSHIDIVYIIEGNEKEISTEKIEHAISLSQEKYCSVSAVIKKAGIPIEWSYKIKSPSN